MQPWEQIAAAEAPDGAPIVLRRRGREYLIVAGGRDLMSSADERSARALGTLGCAALSTTVRNPRVLIGGLGMGYTVRAVLDRCARSATVDVVELVPAVIGWNETVLGDLAGHPLRDRRATVHVADVGVHLRRRTSVYDAILLDVDNGPTALTHATNDALYGPRGLREAWTALRPGGVLGIWSFADDPRFTTRLHRQGFTVGLHKVPGSRRGRGKHHVVWIARRPGVHASRRQHP